MINFEDIDIEQVDKAADILQYIKTGKVNVEIKSGIGLLYNLEFGNYFSLKNKIITPLNFGYYGNIKKGYQRNKNSIPSAIVIRNKPITLLINADTNWPFFSLIHIDDNFPSISFNCLNRFYPNKKITRLFEEIASNKLKIVDFTPNQKINSRKSPGLGFTRLGNIKTWHRPSSILLYDTVNKFTLLFGMDEGSYFGVELPTNPKTIEKAFGDLIPQSCRGIQGVKRQGEWFARPEKAGNIPSVSNCDLVIDNIEHDYLSLPRDSEKSSKHFIECSCGRVKNGVCYFYDPTLYHENAEHQDLSLMGWYSFHKNAAKRSFSEQGVD